MIISASRRTDIPTYFSEWFARRVEEESDPYASAFECLVQMRKTNPGL